MKDNTQLHDKKKQFLEILEKTLGNITATASKMGIERKTVYNWKDKDPEFAKAIKEVQEENVVDYVESLMMKKIGEGESNMIMFFLNNKAKHRGYGQQRDREQSNNRVTTINIIHSDDDNEANTEQ